MTSKIHISILVFLVSLSGCTKDNPIETDTQAPTVSILFPVNGSEIKSDTMYIVAADAKDNKGVIGVEFYIDDYSVGRDYSSPYEYSWNTTGKSGDHSIVAMASDAAGNIGTSTVSAVKVIMSDNPPGVPSDMAAVTGGIFQMGSTSGNSDEQPVHSVILKSFWISKYEVTVKRYRDYCASDGISMPSTPSWGWHDNDPIVNVSWNDAVAYCQWLSSTTGKSVRLPTEAEWEIAARGGTKSSGYAYSGSNTIDRVAWYYSNAGNRTHSVGTRTANELGIYDMSGNVWEWCNDWYGPYSATTQTNPRGPATGTYKVLRGGSWINDGSICRVSLRTYADTSAFGSGLGFRIVQD
jgi:formylglycine-generating enzyme